MFDRPLFIPCRAIGCDPYNLVGIVGSQMRSQFNSLFRHLFQAAADAASATRRTTPAPRPRKRVLAELLRDGSGPIRFNEHLEGDGPTIWRHACGMKLEGIVSKRAGSRYVSGRTDD